jgi:hypothetical protein
MITIKDEKSLLEQLLQDVEECGKEKIVLFAGHFPLFYTENEALEAIEHWGEFSNYSLEIACKVGRYAKNNGKAIEFVFFADDHSYESFNKLGISQVKSRRRKLYKEKSGDEARLHPKYQEIMNQHGFNEDNVLRHNHGKKDRESCLYFSEKILRSSEREIDNVCAREYTEFIEDPKYFNKDNSHLISFVPNRCRGHICDVALDEEIENLSASHVFMETMMPMATREELYSFFRGVTHRRD